MLGFQIHRGEPRKPTKIRAWTESYSFKLSDQERKETMRFTDHEIARWYGISYRLKWFVGIWFLGDTAYPSEVRVVPKEEDD